MPNESKNGVYVNFGNAFLFDTWEEAESFIAMATHAQPVKFSRFVVSDVVTKCSAEVDVRMCNFLVKEEAR